MAAPLPWCHLDGRLMPLAEARISPFDRSFLFGDGIHGLLLLLRRKSGVRHLLPMSRLDRPVYGLLDPPLHLVDFVDNVALDFGHCLARDVLLCGL